MDKKRWFKLEFGAAPSHLSKKEVAEGWHFCDDWDGLLIGPGMHEFEDCCTHKTDIKKAQATASQVELKP